MSDPFSKPAGQGDRGGNGYGDGGHGGNNYGGNSYGNDQGNNYGNNGPERAQEGDRGFKVGSERYGFGRLLEWLWTGLLTNGITD